MELFRSRIHRSEEKSSLFLDSGIEVFFVSNVNKECFDRKGDCVAISSVGVNGDASGRLLGGKVVAAGAFSSFLAGGQAVAPGGVTRLLSGPPSGANSFLLGCRRCRADLCGDLHSSGINFRSKKVCRSEKKVLQAKTALAVRPGCGRRSFAVHNQVVSRCGSPLMFKHRPGVKSVVGLWGWVSFSFGGSSL